MYIRATKTHIAGGQPGYSFRLVRSERRGDRVRQRTLLNLGTDYPVPRAHWQAVADIAEGLLHGQDLLFPPEPDILAAADLDTLGHDSARSVGAERICLKALEELHFPDLLQRLGVGERDARIAVALVMAKMLQPSSEHKAHIWLHHTSTTLELLGLDGGQGPSLSKLYRTNDLLWKHREALQKGLFLRERQLLDLPATIVFYDLSNTFYTGHANATLRRFGRSKQKRSDCPLITLALVLDGAGFPRSCEILPGNASEPGSLEGALARLEAVRDGDGPQPTVVMDAGIASEANLAWLRQQGYDWICVSRAAKPDPPAGAAAATLATSAGHAVQAWQLASEDAGEAQLYAVSERQADQRQADPRQAPPAIRERSAGAPRRPFQTALPEGLRPGSAARRAPPREALESVAALSRQGDRGPGRQGFRGHLRTHAGIR